MQCQYSALRLRCYCEVDGRCTNTRADAVSYTYYLAVFCCDDYVCLYTGCNGSYSNVYSHCGRLQWPRPVIILKYLARSCCRRTTRRSWIIIVYLLWTELYVWEAVGSVSGRAFVITRWHVFTVSNYDIILIWKQTIPEIIKRKILQKLVLFARDPQLYSSFGET